MLKVLLRQRLEMLGTWLTGATRKSKKQSKGVLIAFTALMIYALGALGFLFWHIFDTIAQPFHMVGLDWLFFSFAAVMSFGLMFIGSVFTAKAQLYEAHDNDLLLSLPIPPRYILLSRLFMLFVISFVLDLLVAVPALMICSRHGLLTAWGYVAFAVVFLLLPLLTLAVGALFAWFLSLATAKVQRKSLVTTVLTFAFLGVYMYFSINMNKMLLSLAEDPTGLAGSLGAVAPVYWMGIAIAEDNVPALIGASLIMVGAFVVMYVLLSKTFIRTATNKQGTRMKKASGEVSVSSANAALFHRELTHFFNCPAYMINAGLGTVLALIAAAALLIKRSDILSVIAELSRIPELNEYLVVIAMALLCTMASMMLYTTPSVALEGKSLWIAQSLPVDCREVLRAKLRLHNLFSLPPMVIATIAVAVIVRPAGILLPCFFVLPVLYGVFMGLLGLVENLRHPALDWTSETQAVKSGIGVLITLLGSWGILAVPVLLVILVDGLSLKATVLIFTAVIAVSCAVLYKLLMGWGVKRFMSL